MRAMPRSYGSCPFAIARYERLPRRSLGLSFLLALGGRRSFSVQTILQRSPQSHKGLTRFHPLFSRGLEGTGKHSGMACAKAAVLATTSFPLGSRSSL